MVKKVGNLLAMVYLVGFACAPAASPDKQPVAQVANKLPGLPDDIQGYTSWFKLNDQLIEMASDAPHKGPKNIYVSQAKDTIKPGGQYKFPFPDKTIVVKEALHPEKKYIELIAIMRKIKGLDPDHGDWQFHEYTRSGPDEPFNLAFKDNTCFGCHSAGKEQDWLRFLQKEASKK